jgi:methionine synthase II (cobalamin-independent)
MGADYHAEVIGSLQARVGGWAIPFRDEQGNELLFKRAVVVSRLERRRHMCAEEFTYLRARIDGPAKATVIGRHPGVTFALHLCRGNNQSKFIGSGGYDPIAARIFSATRFSRFLLEYDDSRSGGFEPLRHVPDDRTIVLGPVTTKHAALESPAELERRIRAAAALVPLERLALSPQCGFASTEEGNLLTPAEQEAKLALVVDTARKVWSQN